MTVAAPRDAAGEHPFEEHVLLVSMPFGALERPSLALGTLQAHCNRLGVRCRTRYLNVRFAEHAGLEDYRWAVDELPYTAFAAEWVFAEALYGSRPADDEAYVEQVLRGTWRLGEEEVSRLVRLRAHVEPFLDDVLAEMPWEDFTLVGFTSVFQQNIASLALAKRVRDAWPDVTLAFGGANWEEAMGIALQRRFPFVDLVFSGEADESFPAVLEARRSQRPVTGIPGVRARGRRGAGPKVAPPVGSLDSLPVPDFDAYFEQLRSSPVTSGVGPTLLVETARGCWWGERSHCTFCGLNGSTMRFRSKSPERVIAELTHLRDRHGVSTFSVVDDILDMAYFESTLPRLTQARLGLDLFWEIKANLTHRHVRRLRDAGVLHVQPGIESLSDHVLKLMRKGTTVLRNVELLKWCKEYGVTPLWNLLYGFPGETAADYEQIVDVIHTIWHLDPPTAWGPIRLDRFSPYHQDPEAFGMVDVRPMAPFPLLYPFGRASVSEIAYYFDFDYADGRADGEYARDALDLTRAWMADSARGLVSLQEDESGALHLFDNRHHIAEAPRRATLTGWKAAVFLACDRARTLRSLRDLDEVREEGVDEGELRAFLDRCVRHRFMLSTDGSWLSVAIHVPARRDRESSATTAASAEVGVLTA